MIQPSDLAAAAESSEGDLDVEVFKNLQVPPEVQAEFDAQLDAYAAELEAALSEHFGLPADAHVDEVLPAASTHSQCADCVHFWRHRRDVTSCNAFPFPEWIPAPLIQNKADHSKPYPGDHGVHFLPRAAGSRD